MKLMLKLVSSAGVEIKTIILKQNTATLGRNDDNSLVLEDPMKYISGQHAVIDYRAPDYFITDTSINGVFINDTTEPVGNGKSAKLKGGDQLHIGDYLVEVRVVDEQLESSEITSKLILNETIDFAVDPFAELDTDPVQNLIDENQLLPPDWKDDESVSDPFNLPDSDHFDSGIKEESIERDASLEQPLAFKEAFQPNKAKQQQQAIEDALPENWFEESTVEKQSPPEELFPEDFFVKKKAGDEIAPESKSVNQHTGEFDNQVEKVVENENSATIIKNFLSGAGLEDSGIDEALTPEAFFIIGRILRVSIQGTMDVLTGRAQIKNEMHLDATMIRSGQNNPVKFSVSAEEAIRKLLVPQDAGYLPAEEAIEEAFNDIRAHQFSVIAGMQTALLELLKRFDPQKLEQQFKEKSSISAKIPIYKQAKLWRRFENLYEEIEGDASDNFYKLFGQVFADTYEQQIINLKKSKKESPF